MRDIDEPDGPAAKSADNEGDRTGDRSKTAAARIPIVAHRPAKSGPVLPATLATTDRKLSQKLEQLEALSRDLSAAIDGIAAGSSGPARETRRQLGRIGKELDEGLRLLDHRQRLETQALSKSTHRVIGEIVAHATRSNPDKIVAAVKALDAGQPINEVAEILNLMIVE